MARPTRSTVLKITLAVLAVLAVLFLVGNRVPPPQIASAAGKPAPDFTLKDQDGKDFTLSSQRGHKVLLMFYRGYW